MFFSFQGQHFKTSQKFQLRPERSGGWLQSLPVNIRLGWESWRDKRASLFFWISNSEKKSFLTIETFSLLIFFLLGNFFFSSLSLPKNLKNILYQVRIRVLSICGVRVNQQLVFPLTSTDFPLSATPCSTRVTESGKRKVVDVRREVCTLIYPDPLWGQGKPTARISANINGLFTFPYTLLYASSGKR